MKGGGTKPDRRQGVAAGQLVQASGWRHRLLARIYGPANHVRNRLRHLLGQQSIGVCALILRGGQSDPTDPGDYGGQGDEGDMAAAGGGRAQVRELLLVRHSYRPGWCLPGGGLKRGETPVAGLAREVLEEVGLTLTAPPRLLQVYRQDWYGMVDYPILFAVDGDRGVAGTARLMGGLEILELGWFALDALPADIHPAVLCRLAEWRGERPPSEAW
jgi:8-oxo-dGTP pyrophosphatase MutT (NUDIX family)